MWARLTKTSRRLLLALLLLVTVEIALVAGFLARQAKVNWVPVDLNALPHSQDSIAARFDIGGERWRIDAGEVPLSWTVAVMDAESDRMMFHIPANDASRRRTADVQGAGSYRVVVWLPKGSGDALGQPFPLKVYERRLVFRPED